MAAIAFIYVAVHPALGTPVRVNLLSGVIATLFMVAATQLQNGAAAAAFGVVLNVAVSTLLMSYLLIVPSAYRLRRHGDPGAFKVPGGRGGLLVCTGLAYSRVLLGVWRSPPSSCSRSPNISSPGGHAPPQGILADPASFRAFGGADGEGGCRVQPRRQAPP